MFSSKEKIKKYLSRKDSDEIGVGSCLPHTSVSYRDDQGRGINLVVTIVQKSWV